MSACSCIEGNDHYVAATAAMDCPIHGELPPEQSDRPPPRFSVRPTGMLNGWDEMLLPRPYLYSDGDLTNAVINVGVNFGTRYGDPLLSFGLNLIVPPRLFWLLDPLLRLVGE